MIVSGRLVTLLLPVVTLLQAQQYLYIDGIGPIVTDTRVWMQGKKAELEAWATNESGVAIKKAWWCVQALKEKKKCAFTFGTHRTFAPGETFKWHLSGGVGRGLPKHYVMLLSVSPVTKFDAISKIYVGAIDGNNSGMAREQLIAVLTNTGRFKVVEDEALADAVIRGRSETREAGTAFASLGQSAGLGTASGEGSASTHGGIVGATVRGRVGSLSRSTSEGKTETIISEALVLRLTLPSGENIWAWDNTGTCNQPKVKCAVEDLVSAATK